jgi:hypothetical protein
VANFATSSSASFLTPAHLCVKFRSDSVVLIANISGAPMCRASDLFCQLMGNLPPTCAHVRGCPAAQKFFHLAPSDREERTILWTSINYESSV